ncbi:MAG: hypothetical protein V7725_01120 [Porticoccus sp.]
MNCKANLLAMAACFFGGLAIGQAAFAAENLGETATNPISNLIQFRLQDRFTASNHNVDGNSNAGIVQVVAPLPGLASKFDSLTGIVTRITTAAYVTTPDFDGIGRENGLGDTSVLVFAVPKATPDKTVWGIGPAITIPTASNDYTGAGQWQAGPAAVVMVSPKKGLQVGMLAFQQWDVAETRSDAADVSQLSLQPILTKHFDKGWYLALPDNPQVYDFETNDWTLNLGGVLGRVFPVAGRPMQIFAGAYYNPMDNDDAISAEWTIKMQVGWLFPQ